MNLVKTRAIVLRSLKYSDTSNIVTLFTEDYGKLNAIVKGSRGSKSLFRGNLESFNEIMAIFNKKENRELQVLRNAENLNSFSFLKSDLNRLSVAYSIASLLDSCLHEYDRHIDSYNVALLSLHYLNSESEPLEKVRLYFKINFLKTLGLNIIDNNSKLGETFIANNSLKLNEKQFDIVKAMNIKQYSEINKLNIEDEDDARINAELDHIFDDNTYRKTNRKAKSILQSMQLDTFSN